MCCSRVISKVLILSLLSLSLVLEGCVVFNAVGTAISNGYENTVTYFNLYYNARSAFVAAEAQIVAARKAARGKPVPSGQQQQIPAEAQKNLDLVIDKCSNILAYHSSSSMVDGSLMMIGKAFYYRGDYSKAERKFQELITQYPESSNLLEAQLWYVRSERSLGQYDDARKSADALIADLSGQGQNDILAHTYAQLASLDIHDNAIPAAIEAYNNEVKTANSDNVRGEAYAAVAQLYFDEGQYQQAVEASSNVENFSDDPYLIFQSKLLASRSYRHLRQYDKAIALTDEMADDYRFKDYAGFVYLERANTLADSGRPADAFELYRMVDTTYARTEPGASADIKLAEYYEQSGDYAKVRDYYSRAAAVPAMVPDVDINRKIGAINSYFLWWKELTTADSLLAIIAAGDSSRRVLPVRSASASDSAWSADSARFAARLVRDSIAVDTLTGAKSRDAAGLGELFYTDLANPDSAIYWLKFALRQRYDATQAPRILYILSELATAHPDKSTVTAKEYQNKLIKDFPDSYFARQIQTGVTVQKLRDATADSATEAYASAETLIEMGKNQEAMVALNHIVRDFPATQVAAKSQYALGWMYENRLANMDSAAIEYKRLASRYPSTPFAAAVSGRMLDTLAAAPARTDSLSKSSQMQTPRQDSLRVRQTGIATGQQKPGAPLSRRARILQSMNVRKSERE